MFSPTLCLSSLLAALHPDTLLEAQMWQEHWFFHLSCIFGAVVGAIGGAIASSRVRMDMFGLICCGTVAALGGGTLRDMLLGGLVGTNGEVMHVYWLSAPDDEFLYYAVATSALVFYITRFYKPPMGTLRIFDAFALAFFSLFGVFKAHLLGCSWLVSLSMGVCTGVAGGALRDLITGNVPYVFRPGELYATASVVGAGSYLLLMEVGVPIGLSFGISVFICFATRMGAIYLNWQLPSYRPIFEDMKVEDSEEKSDN